MRGIATKRMFWLYSSRNKLGNRPHILVDIRRDKILNMFWEHRTLDEISSELDIPIRTIRYCISRARRQGDERALRRTGLKRLMQAQARRRRIIALYESGVVDASEIAALVGCCVRLVQLRLREVEA